ncbi:MAG TPA: roadblock/LC7 domain-containing protein, partial [Verrucomicrobiae bacterium]
SAPPAPAPIAAPAIQASLQTKTPEAALAAEPTKAAAKPSNNKISIPLATLISTWPEMLRKEIEHLNLTSSVLAVPVELLENGLKQGKVGYPWKQVCQWIEACPPAAFASSFADIRLEWPLAVVAPLFLQSRPNQEQKRPSVKIDIPDLFNQGGLASASTAVTPAAPTAQSIPAPASLSALPSPAPAPTVSAEAASAAAPKKLAKDLAELFGDAEKRNWTPNEIVHKTCLLPGLDGALIALQDGLLVASCMPPTWKTDTIAAFLPQIFGRMHQYTRELKMGELQSVTFTVDSGTLQIFNAGIIYFAALGKPGASLPVPELNLIARELSRHTK